MNRYTFRLGDRTKTGLELHFSVGADLVTDAIRLGRAQLREQFDAEELFTVELDWGLSGKLIIDLEQICEANLISAVPIKSFSEGQLDLEFAVVTPIRRHGRVIATTKAA
jgi:hypothetical protein